MLVESLSINDSLDEPTFLKLSSVYSNAISRNNLRLIENKLVYLEPVSVVTTHSCIIIMYNISVASYIGEYKSLYSIKIRFF